MRIIDMCPIGMIVCLLLVQDISMIQADDTPPQPDSATTNSNSGDSSNSMSTSQEGASSLSSSGNNNVEGSSSSETPSASTTTYRLANCANYESDPTWCVFNESEGTESTLATIYINQQDQIYIQWTGDESNEAWQTDQTYSAIYFDEIGDLSVPSPPTSLSIIGESEDSQISFQSLNLSAASNLNSISLKYIDATSPLEEIFGSSQGMSLESLSVLSCGLDSFSYDLKDYGNLTILDLSNNSFSDFPDGLLVENLNKTVTLTGSFSEQIQLNDTEYEVFKANYESGYYVISGDYSGNCNGESKVATSSSSNSTITICVSNEVVSGSGSDSSSIANTASSSDSSTWKIIVTVVVVVIGALLIIAGTIFYLKRRKKTAQKNMTSSSNENVIHLLEREEPPSEYGAIFEDADLIRIPPFDISLTKQIGGSSLWMGEYNDHRVVVKRLEGDTVIEENISQLKRIKELVHIRHNNIISLIGVSFLTNTDVCILAEYMDKGNLSSVLRSPKVDLSWDQKLSMCIDVTSALDYLHTHSPKIFYHKLKSRNVLVNSSMQCKLNIFDCVFSADSLEFAKSYGVGVVAWIAPELFSDKTPHQSSVDIYALGVLFCEISTRKMPYASQVDELGNVYSDIAIVKKHLDYRLSPYPHEDGAEFKSTPPAFQGLVDKCLSLDPSSRPSAKEILDVLQGLRSSVSSA